MVSLLILDAPGAACDELMQVLRSGGHSVVFAADADDARRLLSAVRPAVMLVGLQVPGLDGIEFVRCMLADPIHADMPVLHVAHEPADSDMQIASLEAGAEGCVSLPMPPRELLARMHSLVRRQQSIAALRHVEQRQRSLIEQMGDGVLVVGYDDRAAILFANSAACRMLARTASQLVGLPFGYALPADGPVELELLHDETPPRLVQMRATTSEWDGRPAQLVSLHDVSELQEAARLLRDREQRYRSLFEQHLDSVFLLDPVGRIVEGNAAFIGLTGWSQFDSPPSDFKPFVAPEMLAFTEAQFARALAGEPVRYETVARHRDGTRISVEVTNLPMVVDGVVSGVYGIAHDITRRKTAESALLHSRALLDIAGRAANVGGWSFTVEPPELIWSDGVARIHDKPAGYCPDLDQAVAFYAPESRSVFRSALDACINGGVAFDKELEIVTARGKRRWVRSIGEPMFDRSGRILRVHGAIQEISDRKAAERATAELAQRLETTLESIAAACVTLDRDWRVIYLNGHAGELLGRDRLSLYGKVLWEEFPLLVDSEVYRECMLAARERRPVSFETCFAAHKMWLGITAYPAGDGLAVFVRDVTAQRRDAQRMRLLEACIARCNDIVLICDAAELDEPGPRTVYVNPAFERTTGYAPAEIIGRSPRLLQGPQTDRRALQRIRTALERGAGAREEVVNYTKDGHPIWLELDIAPVADESGAFTHWIAIQRDIGGRKAAEQASAESLARFRLLAEASLDAIGEWNLVTGEMWWSDGYQRLFGRSPETTDSAIDGWSRYIHPDDRPGVLADLQDFATGEDDKSSTEYRYAHADGRWLDVLVRVQMIRDADGRPVRMVGGMTDLSEVRGAHRRLESQLARMELLHRITHAIGERDDLDSIYRIVCDRVAGQMPAPVVAVCELGNAGQTLQIRHLATRATAGQTFTPLVEAMNRGAAEGDILRAFTGEMVYEADTREAAPTWLQAFGSVGLLSVVLAPLQVESDIFGVLLIARAEAAAFSGADCEFLRQLSGHVALAANQAQLHRALQSAYDRLRHTQQAVLKQERLRALGEMASGIAHDINNAISPAALYAEAMLESETGLTARSRERLEVILRAIEDVAHTVARMREFYRPRDETVLRQPVDLTMLIEQVVELTRARWRDMPQRAGVAVEVVREFTPSLPRVAVVDSDVREALTNLIFNAVDAMPRGGRLSLRTLLQPSVVDGGRVTVEVEDDGVGMDEATLKQCMEPFFTTKGERGTGLGLAMVYGTAQRHGGEVEIDSRPGSGTRVRLHLPIHADAPVAAPVTLPRQEPVRTLHLLVVDDDPLILRSLSEMLRDQGHHVETANGGAAAVERLLETRSGASFDLIMTDLGMPHVDGLQVARVAKANSAAPVVMLTGWGQRMNEDGEHPPCVDRVLAKPPRLAELRHVLEQLCPAVR